jgi:hypothetical protein
MSDKEQAFAANSGMSDVELVTLLQGADAEFEYALREHFDIDESYQELARMANADQTAAYLKAAGAVAPSLRTTSVTFNFLKIRFVVWFLTFAIYTGASLLAIRLIITGSAKIAPTAFISIGLVMMIWGRLAAKNPRLKRWLPTVPFLPSSSVDSKINRVESLIAQNRHVFDNASSEQILIGLKALRLGLSGRNLGKAEALSVIDSILELAEILRMGQGGSDTRIVIDLTDRGYLRILVPAKYRTVLSLGVSRERKIDQVVKTLRDLRGQVEKMFTEDHERVPAAV